MSVVVVAFFMSRWVMIKESPGHEAAIQFLLNEDKSLKRSDIDMLGFSRTAPVVRKNADEIIYYKFEIRDALMIEIAASRRGEVWTAEVFSRNED